MKRILLLIAILAMATMGTQAQDTVFSYTHQGSTLYYIIGSTGDAMLVAQVTEVDADGEILDCVPHYLTGEPPKCDVCGTDMVYIPDPCAPVTKCPRCGLDHMIISAEMMFD